MRLRNIPGADEAVSDKPLGHPGRGRQKKENGVRFSAKNQPLYIEVGMGKGQFITELSRRNPEINYIGIERYTSVLYRALQKRELLTEECGEEFPNLRYLCVDAKDLPETSLEKARWTGSILISPIPGRRNAMRDGDSPPANFWPVMRRSWLTAASWSSRPTTAAFSISPWRK